MVHISGEGQVVSSTPWSLTRFVGEIFNAITLFFSTLISPASNRFSSGNSRNSGSRSCPRPPRRPIGRINTMNVDVPIPGCRSCQG